MKDRVTDKHTHIHAVAFAEQERERQVIHLLFHSPVGCNIRSWARLKPEAGSSVQVSQMMTGALST